MAEIVQMPKMSDTMVEGVIAKWHKKVGDSVKSGELMAEIETDKATMDYESFNSGTVLYLGAKEGEAVKINDVPVLTPEWLVILKFIAGRFKDQEDAVFLLSRKGLVDRRIIKEKIIKHVGRNAWELAKHGYQRWYDMADGRAREDERNEAEGYIDS